MSVTINLKTVIQATPEQIYKAWLTSELHEKMTEGDVCVSSFEVGAKFKAHGQYIWGENLELIPNKKIIQSWRSSSFKSEDEDSIIEVSLVPIEEGTELQLVHKNLPESEVDVEQGWATHYFEPMKRFFGKK